MYKVTRIKGLKFYFKYELIDAEYLPHVFVRHLVEPKEVIAAYLNSKEVNYNETFKRYEAYSEADNLNVYYTFRKNNKSEILIITAFRE
jgi:hypothetical protein